MEEPIGVVSCLENSEVGEIPAWEFDPPLLRKITHRGRVGMRQNTRDWSVTNKVHSKKGTVV